MEYSIFYVILRVIVTALSWPSCFSDYYDLHIYLQQRHTQSFKFQVVLFTNKKSFLDPTMAGPSISPWLISTIHRGRQRRGCISFVFGLLQRYDYDYDYDSSYVYYSGGGL